MSDKPDQEFDKNIQEFQVPQIDDIPNKPPSLFEEKPIDNEVVNFEPFEQSNAREEPGSVLMIE